MRVLKGLGLGLVIAATLFACGPKKTDTTTGGAAPQPAGSPVTVRVYTSLYREVVDVVKPVVEEKAAKANAKVEWVQAGSRKIAARLEKEWGEGKDVADILLTADPAFYKRLKAENKLVSYKSPEAARIPAQFKDADGYWATARFSTMVIGISPEVEAGMVTPKPASFKDLADVKGLPRIAMGDPNMSGTTFTTVASLSQKLGWDYFKALKTKKTLSAGSNSTVQQRLDTGESDAGICLLENLLLAKAGGSKIGVVYPTEGAIVIPGPIALLPHAKESKEARAVYDAILSADVQKIFVEQGFMHSPDPALATPAGAPALDKLMAGAPAEALFEPTKDADAIKTEFTKIFAKAENK